MKFNRLAILPLAAVLLGALSSCGGGGDKPGGNTDSGGGNIGTSVNPNTEINVAIYDGGYGTAWIEEMAKGFKAKTGITVNYEADTSLLDRIQSALKNGGDYDLYMSHDINWKEYAAQGYLEPLDDLYSTTVEGKTFKERLVSGAAESSFYDGEQGEHYYKVNYTQGAGGLVYNVDLFEEHNWTVPETYADLVKLCQDIVDAEVSVGAREYLVPFAWSGTDRQYYWDYLVFEWWAQLAGVEKVNTVKQYKGPTGKYADGYEMYNPSTYYKEFYEAYDMWYNLVAANSKYSTANAYGSGLLAAQSAFASGKAAMIPYGQWAKLEIEKAVDAKLSFDTAMMVTPKAKSDSPIVNYQVGFGDSMIIPEKSPSENKAAAKQFLAYMASEEGCKIFATQSQGAFLAFDYSNVDLSEAEATDTYLKSMHTKVTAGTNFNLYSSNEITVWNANTVMPWLNNNYYYATAASGDKNSVSSVIGPKMYSDAQTGWKTWLSSAGLKD